MIILKNLFKRKLAVAYSCWSDDGNSCRGDGYCRDHQCIDHCHDYPCEDTYCSDTECYKDD